MKDIRLRFAGVEKSPDDQFSYGEEWRFIVRVEAIDE